MATENNFPNAENPLKFTGLKKGKIKSVAAGLPAVLSTLKQIATEAGLVRGLTALANVNQKGGFDCPSCAWPDPDDERSGLVNTARMVHGPLQKKPRLKNLPPLSSNSML